MVLWDVGRAPLALGVSGGHGRGPAFGLGVHGLPAVSWVFWLFLGIVVGWIGPDGSVATATATVGGPCLAYPWWECGAGSGWGLFSFDFGGWFSGLVFGFLGSGCMTTGWMCISTWGLFALGWCPFLGWGIGMPGPSLGAPFLSGDCANGERKDYRPCYMQL